MNITAKELSGMHIGKTIAVYDRTADQFAEGKLTRFESSEHRVEIWIERDAVPTYASPEDEITFITQGGVVLTPFSGIRLNEKYKLFPVFVNFRDQVDLVVKVTKLYRDSAGIEMVKFEPGTYACNAYGYESVKYFKAKFEQVAEAAE